MNFGIIPLIIIRYIVARVVDLNREIVKREKRRQNKKTAFRNMSALDVAR